MNAQSVLIIDDEPDIRELLEITLLRMGLKADSASNAAEAYAALQARRYDLCLTDMRLPDGDGLDIIAHAQQQYPRMPIAMITAYGCIETATRALKAGAFDFITKPMDLKRLRELVQSALKQSAGQQSVSGDSPLLGHSRPMQQLRQKIGKLAHSQAPVHISGESGTGKEVVAREIHQHGNRAGQPFIPVNCGAIPAELMESEFFGHKKGSFTGAHSNQDGLFQAAHGGTLFLDEVADLPLHMQVKLLRALQEKSVRPVGSQQELPVDVRILSATHKDLAAEVAAGRFRQDLYYRLNVIEIRVPPLRERGDDILELAQVFLQRLCSDGRQVRLSKAAMDKLCQHDFPGNVRELENMLERAYTLCDHAVIQPHDLQMQTAQRLIAPATEAATTAIVPEQSTASYSRTDRLENTERSLIQRTLEHCGHDQRASAKQLGISLRSLRYRMKVLDIS
jgi:two-component system response regulator PilR (NtrC family)